MTNENIPPAPSGSEDDVPRNAKGQPLWPRPPRKPLTGWVLLLPAFLLVGAIWVTTRAQPGEGVTPDSGNTAPPPVVQSTPRVTKKPPVVTSAGQKVALYLPNDQAELTRREVPVEKLTGNPLKGSLSDNFEVVGKAALQRIIAENPSNFPEGTKVESLKKEGDLITLDLPAGFAAAKLWSQGDSYGMLATDAIVNTLASIAGDGKLVPVKVRFLSGGKPFELLGELDMTEPLQPNTSSVTKP